MSNLNQGRILSRTPSPPSFFPTNQPWTLPFHPTEGYYQVFSHPRSIYFLSCFKNCSRSRKSSPTPLVFDALLMLCFQCGFCSPTARRLCVPNPPPQTLHFLPPLKTLPEAQLGTFFTVLSIFLVCRTRHKRPSCALFDPFSLLERSSYYPLIFDCVLVFTCVVLFPLESPFWSFELVEPNPPHSF